MKSTYKTLRDFVGLPQTKCQFTPFTFAQRTRRVLKIRRHACGYLFRNHLSLCILTSMVFNGEPAVKLSMRSQYADLPHYRQAYKGTLVQAFRTCAPRWKRLLALPSWFIISFSTD